MTLFFNHKETRAEDRRLIIQEALKNDFSLALYRLPKGKDLNLIAGQEHKVWIESLNEKGFVLAPFQYDEKSVLISEGELYYEHSEEKGELNWHHKKSDAESTHFDDYNQKVRFAKEQIRGGSFDKVVLSRKKLLRSNGIDLLNIFDRLCEAYPEAFICLVSSKSQGTWIGASPELLLQADGDHKQTVALAGTSKDGIFTEKDSIEQKYVSRYIEEYIEKAGADADKTGPEPESAGPVTHLKTQFDIKSEKPWQYWAQALHPTPAVCGYPKVVTRIFVRNEEGYNRELYTGYWGPVDQDHCALFVNLRCMQFLDGSFSLYAGGGILKKSKAKDEWEEAEAKMNTLSKFLTDG